jgi:hypothetical protein
MSAYTTECMYPEHTALLHRDFNHTCTYQRKAAVRKMVVVKIGLVEGGR